MINSLATIIITIHGANVPSPTKQIMAEQTNSLSASGSMNFPKFVIRLYFLAIVPSSLSVIDAATKITSAAHFPQLYGISSHTTKTGSVLHAA